jgi:hypothetical protein
MDVMVYNLLCLLQTPAVFWITNANNYIVNNRAIASRRYGFWYRPEISATGVSLFYHVDMIFYLPPHSSCGIFSMTHYCVFSIVI